MPQQIILDLSRLVYAAWRRTPAGIPRVELAYAQYLHLRDRSTGSAQFAAMDAVGRLCLVERKQAEAFIEEISAFWRDGVSSRAAHWRLMWRAVRLHAKLLVRGPGSLHRTIARFAGQSVYVIVSQLHLDRRILIERLKAKSEVRLVYFVHDVIPLQFPEYFPRGEAGQIDRCMTNAARMADAIITNSEATRRDFLERFGAGGLHGFIRVAPLGIGRETQRAAFRHHAKQDYFVVVGTIEPRKNHLLLLNVWRRIAAKLGVDAPRLLLIGGRGWENENVIDVLERNISLRGIVDERNFVSDDELANILGGARALLLPSLAEGFGLPLAEALAAGVPALCSDLPALREVGGQVPEFLDPLDGPAWQAAILAYASDPSPRREAQLERLRSWSAPDWSEHFNVFDSMIKTLAEGANEPAAARGTLGQSADGSDGAGLPLGVNAGLW